MGFLLVDVFCDSLANILRNLDADCKLKTVSVDDAGMQYFSLMLYRGLRMLGFVPCQGFLSTI